MIIGAFAWGWIGDRFGRLKSLYWSILIYSLGTFACAFVHDPITYGILRLITGFGLAAETGAAITLVAELMSQQKRAWGFTIPIIFAFQYLKEPMGITSAAAIIDVFLYVCAFLALRHLSETHATDLDYLEEKK
ncbi:MAG: MFS transporter [Alphaproteobacteria bacterium]|nr:MFS transporter [Alphaproteobacteria bacterium]